MVTKQATAEGQAEAKLAPWARNPRSLLSWWTMLKRYALDFYMLGQYLARLRKLAEQTQPENEAEVRSLITDIVPMAKESMAALDLEFSNAEVDRWSEKFLKETPIKELAAAINVLNHRIEDEAQRRHLLYVSPAKAKHYDAFDKGWEEAIAKFNQISTDVEEAEKSFALGRFSGCVFHLMRVAEIGVQELGRKMKLPTWKIQEPWGAILKAVQDEVHKMKRTTRAQKKKQHAWSELADALFQVNLAWRIPTEHPRVPGDVYTEDQAEEAIGRVRALMRHLAVML